MSSEISFGTLVTALVIPTLIAVIGFGLNGFLQRSADKRKFMLETQRQLWIFEHERRVLRAILLAELESVSRLYKSELSYIDNNTATYIPAHFFLGFKDMLKSLGMLSSDEVGHVMHTYYVYLERTGYIKKNGLDSSTLPDVESTIPYELIGERKEWLRNDLVEIVEAAELSIKAIKKATSEAETTQAVSRRVFD